MALKEYSPLFIRGLMKKYNDICRSWNYQLLLPFFGADAPSRTFNVKTRQELDYLLEDQVFSKADVIQVAEIHMDKYDYPWRLSTQVEFVNQALRKRAEERAKAKKLKANGKI
jgi:pyruvate decarboxylase